MLKKLRKRFKKKYINDVNSLSIITKNNILLNVNSPLIKKKSKIRRQRKKKLIRRYRLLLKLTIF